MLIRGFFSTIEAGEKLIEKRKVKSRQIQLVSVESLVPKNHLLRKINKVMDFECIYRLVEEKYSKDIGRPSMPYKRPIKKRVI